MSDPISIDDVNSLIEAARTPADHVPSGVKSRYLGFVTAAEGKAEEFEELKKYEAKDIAMVNALLNTNAFAKSKHLTRVQSLQTAENDAKTLENKIMADIDRLLVYYFAVGEFFYLIALDDPLL